MQLMMHCVPFFLPIQFRAPLARFARIIFLIYEAQNFRSAVVSEIAKVRGDRNYAETLYEEKIQPIINKHSKLNKNSN